MMSMWKLFSFRNRVAIPWGCVLFILVMVYSQPSFALLCRNNQTGYVFSSGDTNFNIILPPTVQYNKLITILDLEQLVSCQNEDSSGQNYDFLRVRQGSGFSQSLDAKTYGRVDFATNLLRYSLQLPLQQDIRITGDYWRYGIWKPFPVKMHFFPESGVLGKLIRAGELVATIYITNLSTQGEGIREQNFTWRFYAANDVYLESGTCHFSENNIKVDLPPYPGTPVMVPLTIRCDQTQQVNYTLSGSTIGNNTIFANTATSGARGVGIKLSDNSGPVQAGQMKSLGQVGSVPVSLGLKASYALIDQGSLTPGTVQSVINVTFSYN